MREGRSWSPCNGSNVRARRSDRPSRCPRKSWCSPRVSGVCDTVLRQSGRHRAATKHQRTRRHKSAVVGRRPRAARSTFERSRRLLGSINRRDDPVVVCAECAQRRALARPRRIESGFDLPPAACDDVVGISLAWAPSAGRTSYSLPYPLKNAAQHRRRADRNCRARARACAA